MRITCNDYVIETIFRPKLQGFSTNTRKSRSSSRSTTASSTSSRTARRRAGRCRQQGHDCHADRPGFSLPRRRRAVLFRLAPPPRDAHDLTKLPCINLRSMTAGSSSHDRCEERKGDQRARRGQLAYNSVLPILQSAIEGAGLAYLPEDLAAPHLESGTLIALMENRPWTGLPPLLSKSPTCCAQLFRFRETMRYGVTSG